MRSRWGAVVLVALGFALGWAARRVAGGSVSGSDAVRDEAVSRTARIERVERPAAEVREIMAPLEYAREPVLPAASASASQLAARVGREATGDAGDIAVLGSALLEHPWLAGKDLPFVERYAGYSLERLRGASQEVRKRWIAESQRIAAERMGAGYYEIESVPTGASARGIGPTGVSPVASFGISIEAGEGYTTVKTSVNDAAEHPELERLAQESWWLGSLVKKIESQVQSK